MKTSIERSNSSQLPRQISSLQTSCTPSPPTHQESQLADSNG